MSTKEAYLTLAQNCGIKVGDTVKVLRRSDCGELGHDCRWSSDMNNYIGKTFKVTDNRLAEAGIVQLGSWYFPFHILEKVEPQFRPYTPNEVPLGAEVTSDHPDIGFARALITHISINGEVCSPGFRTSHPKFGERGFSLQYCAEHFKISLDHGKTWQPFKKQI